MVSRREFVSLVGASAAGAVLVSPLKALYAREAQGQSIRVEAMERCDQILTAY
jgi:hypothetical protein